MRSAALVLVVASLGCRDRAPSSPPPPEPTAIRPAAPDPRPAPAQVAHLTLKVLGMT